ncbi:hypothetical protein [Runella sp. SP2]|uniref:hypothetical protein n=1 Tax=Runella sp. SP2 TaxID=2268026 RepID=UPI0013DDBFCC|nr:hypothetical protein [Runella sp. SP2]
MKTETAENQISKKANLVRDEYLPSLRNLFNMPGASWAFKSKIKELRDKFSLSLSAETKTILGLEKDIAGLRNDIQKLQRKEQTEQNLADLANREDELETKMSEYQTADEELKQKDIVIEATLIAAKIIPSDKVLAGLFSETYIDEYGRPNSRQSDYVTQIVRIEDLIEQPEA